MKVANTRHSIPRIAYLLLAVTGLGFPVIFLLGLWLARSLGISVPILHLAVGALLMTGLADVVLAIANDRFNRQPDAKLHQLNELVGEKAVVVDGFSSGGKTNVGRVRAQGQIWTAQCDDGDRLEPDQRVRVKDRQGLKLVVTSVS